MIRFRNTHHAERNRSQSTTSQSNDVDKSQPSIPAQKVLPNHDKAATTSTTPRLMIKLHLNQQKHKMQPRTNIQINKIHINPRIKYIDAKQDDTVRQSEQKPQVGDLVNISMVKIPRETDR